MIQRHKGSLSAVIKPMERGDLAHVGTTCLTYWRFKPVKKEEGAGCKVNDTVLFYKGLRNSGRVGGKTLQFFCSEIRRKVV